MWGLRDILVRASKEMASVKNRLRDVPSVALVGEIYVRLDPFANDFVIDKLEERGVRVRMAPFTEWLEYTQYQAETRVLEQRMLDTDRPLAIGLTGIVQRATVETLYHICAKALDWAERLKVTDAVRSAKPYINPALAGEACLTLGGPITEFQHKQIQGVVIVGPHECMPCRIAEAQYGKVAEDMGMPYLSISLNGDPMDTEALDRFAYDIHEAHRKGLGRDLAAVMTRMGSVGREPVLNSQPSHPVLVDLRRSATGPSVTNGRRALD